MIFAWPSSPRRGLSPRVRGNRPFRVADQLRVGSIPACAGEPISPTPRADSDRVYPRVCGGTNYVGLLGDIRYGLSPRVRGNRRRQRQSRTRLWSIPACAGEPPTRPAPSASMRVYPRVCGGTQRGSRSRCGAAGLSPRVRGNLSGVIRAGVSPGSIPACAGEPSPHARRECQLWVYPRVCGGTHVCR